MIKKLFIGVTTLIGSPIAVLCWTGGHHELLQTNISEQDRADIEEIVNQDDKGLCLSDTTRIIFADESRSIDIDVISGSKNSVMLKAQETKIIEYRGYSKEIKGPQSMFSSYDIKIDFTCKRNILDDNGNKITREITYGAAPNTASSGPDTPQIAFPSSDL